MTQLPKIIALCGYKRCGKDTAANYIQRFGYQKVSIAQPLKDSCKGLFGLTDEQLHGSEKEIVLQEYGVTPRKLMQFFGTEMMQLKLQEICPTQGKKFWINRLLKSVSKNERYVISDLRFHHEYDSLKELYGDSSIVIKVLNSHIIEQDEHISETEWKKINVDYVVHNNTDIEYLHRQIDEIFYKLEMQGKQETLAKQGRSVS